MTNLKKVMKTKNISGTTLALKTGVKQNTANHHARNGVKTIRVARRYAKFLDCSPFDLLD